MIRLIVKNKNTEIITAIIQDMTNPPVEYYTEVLLIS